MKHKIKNALLALCLIASSIILPTTVDIDYVNDLSDKITACSLTVMLGILLSEGIQRTLQETKKSQEAAVERHDPSFLNRHIHDITKIAGPLSAFAGMGLVLTSPYTKNVIAAAATGYVMYHMPQFFIEESNDL